MVGVWDKNYFLDANPAQCQLLHWKETAAHFKDLEGIVPFHYEEEEYVEEEE